MDAEICLVRRSGRCKTLPVIARLHVVTGLRGATTFLKSLFFTTPFKIANITEDKNDKCLQLMLMSSSPGILDGDEYSIKIDLEVGSALQLHTQSYQRLFNMNKGASQVMEVYMGKDSSFCFLPHPTVPHKGSDFVATNKIYLSPGCSLVWGEILTCGRKLNGEIFEFSKYHNRTEIFLNDRLVVKENILIKPGVIPIESIGQLEGFTHQASLIFLNDTATITTIISAINELMTAQQNICWGVSVLPVKGLIVRLLGYKSEALYNCLQQIAAIFYVKEEVQKAGNEIFLGERVHHTGGQKYGGAGS